MGASPQVYLPEIERFFSALRMGGFVLSPRDVERVRTWHEQGIPMGVVIRGITEGLRAWRGTAAPADRPPHTLAYYQPRIRTHVRTFRREEEGAWNARARPVRFVAARRAELELLQAAEDREPEHGIKARLGERLAALEARIPAESLEEGGVAYELLLLDAEILQLYHQHLTGTAGPPTAAEEDGLRARLRIPTLRYWST